MIGWPAKVLISEHNALVRSHNHNPPKFKAKRVMLLSVFFLMTLFWKRRETIPLVEMKVKMKVAISKQQLQSTNNNVYEWKICWMLWIVMAEQHRQLKSILMSLFTFQRVWVVNSFTKAHKMVSKSAKNVVVFFLEQIKMASGLFKMEKFREK